MVVYTTDTGGYRELAEKIATDRGEAVVDSLDEIGDETVVYVDAPESIDQSALFRLQKRMLRGDPESEHFSIVTGYSPEFAERLYYRDDDAGDENCILLRRPEQEYVPDDELSVYTEGEATVENLERSQQERLKSLSILGPGRQLHIKLADGHLCGFPESQSVSDYDGMQPQCVQNGEMACPFDGELLRAEDVDAAHVFISSCMSMIDNNYADLPVHVGIGLLSSVTSAIGSYRVSPILPIETYLHYALVQSGYDVTDRCQVLNRNAHSTRLKAYPFIPFGRPEATPRSPRENEYAVTTTETESGVRLDFHDVDAHLVELSIPKEIVGEADEYYVRLDEDDADLPLYYFTDDRGRDVDVFLYGGGNIESPGFSVHLDTKPTRHADRMVLSDSLRNAERFDSLGVSNQKMDRQVENFRDEVQKLADQFSHERFDAREHLEIRDEIETTLYDGDKINEQLFELLVEPGLPWYAYGNRVFESGVYHADEPCPMCGNGVFIKQLSDTTRSIHRANGFCPSCGPLFDVPTTPGDTDPTTPEIEADLVAGDVSPATVSIQFENPLDHRMRGSVQYHVSNHTSSLSDEQFDPKRTEFVLEAGESTTFECTFDAEPLSENWYNFYACIIGNNQLYAKFSPVMVGEKVGFLV